MFGDVDIKKEVENALETYSIEEILEHNDLTIEDALVLLIKDGWLILPETQPL